MVGRGLLAAVVAVLLLGGVAVAPPADAVTVDVRSMWKQLKVAQEHDSGYDREAKFGDFIDADGDGCDTRYEVLIAEATKRPKVGAGCYLAGGRWRSLYDGLKTSDPGDLQIDHVVSLSEAWKSGAYKWSQGRRRAYTNDLGYSRTLIAVSNHTNMSKGDRSPGEWTPPALAARCRFVADYIAVKWRWRLTVDSFEKAELGGLLNYCGKHGGARTDKPKRA